MGTHAEPRTPVPAPRLPERYQPVRPIAAGGTAIVWCAEDHRLGRRVAVKLLAEPYASDPAAVRRFKREARAAAHLSGHPHVATIFDVGETSPEPGEACGEPFIVMEYLAGGTVADALRLGAVSLDDAVRWLFEAAGAIDYAHSRGILHRDIKLANLLLDRSRGLHVADFGIAQIGHEDTITNAGQVLGTASYLAPERIMGRPATVASDLYSLAVAAFELLTGERPFTAGSYLAQARQHLEAEPPRASERRAALPPAVDGVLARGMAKAPERRWPSAEAFAAALAVALRPAPAQMPLPASREAALVRGRRAVAARAESHAGRVGPTPTPRPAAARPLLGPDPHRRRRRGPLLVAGALASTALVGGLALAAAGGSGPARRAVAARPATTRTHPLLAAAPRPIVAVHHAPPVHHPAPKPQPTAPAPPPATPAPKPVAAPVAGALALETRGHALLEGGSAGAAIPVLRQAVGAATPGSTLYAYALFDLGSALRQSGQTHAAVRVLFARMQIPNQTDKVRAELTLALQALGRQATSAPPRGPTADAGSSGPAPAADAGQGGQGGQPQAHGD